MPLSELYLLSVTLGSVAFSASCLWALLTRPTVVKVERYPEIPAELSRLAKAFGITEDVDSGKSYGRMIHDYIEGLKADHDAERRELVARAEAAEAKIKANREALKADVEVSLKRLSGIRGTFTMNGSSIAEEPPTLKPGMVADFKPGGGIAITELRGEVWKQTVNYPTNTETWEYTAGPDGKPWSMTGPVGFVPHEVGVAFAKSKDSTIFVDLSPSVGYHISGSSGTIYSRWGEPTGLRANLVGVNPSMYRMPA